MPTEYTTLFSDYDSSLNSYKEGEVDSDEFLPTLNTTLDHLNDLYTDEQVLYEKMRTQDVRINKLRNQYANIKEKTEKEKEKALLSEIQKIDSLHSYQQIQSRFAIIGVLSIGSILVLYQMMKK